jgi:aryl-alcohol dehydrogenase-like predicted oxidoreductase
MNYRPLGTTEIKVPDVCLGTMNWGQQNNEAEAHEQLDYAAANGFYFIDTAEIYPVPPVAEKQGTTERFVGSWLRKRGKRDDVVIASKVASRRQGGAVITTRDATKGVTVSGIMEAIDGTLLRLGTDYVDLYQVHSPERRVNNFGARGYEHHPEEDTVLLEETMEGLANVVKAGKARMIGVSNETPWGAMQYLQIAERRGWPKIVSVQNQYSLLNRTYEIGTAEVGMREGVGLLAYSPLSTGVLTGKYLGGERPFGARHTLWERNHYRYLGKATEEPIRRYLAIAQKYKLDPARMAISFVRSREFVTSAIIGCTSLEQLRNDLQAAELELASEVLAEIEAVQKEFPDPHA